MSGRAVAGPPATASRLVIDPDTRLTAPSGPWTHPVPVPDDDAVPFWTGLAEGELRILRCGECRHWVHPPLAGCPACHAFALEAEPVSGLGTIYSYTVVNREFTPGMTPPYVAALVELDEQPGLRILTDIVDCTIADVAIGVRVQLRLVSYEEHVMPYFTPVPTP